MTTHHKQKSDAKPSGRRYASVSALVQGEGIAPEVKEALVEIENETRLVHQLAMLRQAAGLTQAEVAGCLGVTQGAVSKLESGRDEEITVGQLRCYAKVTGERIGLMFGRPLNHVESVKAHAFGIKKHLSALAKIAHSDDGALEKAIQGFFGEAFFNILDILARCHDELPSRETEVQLEVMGDAASMREDTRTSLTHASCQVKSVSTATERLICR